MPRVKWKSKSEMEKMKCVVVSRAGGPEVLELQERPIPVPFGDQVLIRVHYSGINRPDIFQRKGHYPAPPGAPSDIPGLEVSGEIAACGPLVTQWKPGQKVCALLSGGGYAEYALAHQGQCLPLDPGISFEAGAALPEALFTVWYNVFQSGPNAPHSNMLKGGDNLLVHGGSGGIGTTSIQLATLLGINVYTTAGSDERCRKCEELGAVECVNYRTQDFAEHWRDLKMHTVLDIVGGEYFNKNLRLLAPDGRLVQINCIGGRRVELDLLQLMQQRHIITGSTLRARESKIKEEIRDSILQRAWPLVTGGQFQPVIHQILPFDTASEAHHLLESGSVFGKLLLKWHEGL